MSSINEIIISGTKNNNKDIERIFIEELKFDFYTNTYYIIDKYSNRPSIRIIYNYNKEKGIAETINLFTGKIEKYSLKSIVQGYYIYAIDMRNNTIKEDKRNIKKLFKYMFNIIK